VTISADDDHAVVPAAPGIAGKLPHPVAAVGYDQASRYLPERPRHARGPAATGRRVDEDEGHLRSGSVAAIHHG